MATAAFRNYQRITDRNSLFRIASNAWLRGPLAASLSQEHKARERAEQYKQESLCDFPIHKNFISEIEAQRKLPRAVSPHFER
jgi:hypothetical protein